MRGIGLKMVFHDHYHVSHVVSLAAIAGIIGTGVIASIVATKRAAKKAAATGEPPPESDHLLPWGSRGTTEW